MKLNILIFSGLIFNLFVCKAKEKLNVLFIIADDLNCDIGAYGHPLVKTPNIDRLAKEGMLFENAFCNFPLSGPSRASMMTGLYPDQTGHYKLRDLIRDHVPDAVTMSQNFMNNGYVAARVGKIFHYDNPTGIGTPGHDDPASWNERYFPKGIDREIEDKIFSLKPGRFGAVLSWLAAEEEDEKHTDGMVATKAIELLGKYADSGTPFFLGVGFYKPHTPFVAPKKYFDLYPKNQICIPGTPSGYLSTLPEPAVRSLTTYAEQNNLNDSLAVHALQAYYATISFLDAQVGRVIEALDELGLRENTIIVFTSDNGYHMGEHGYYQKNTLFENSGRIPLIIHTPKMEGKGRTSASLVELIDLYPTLSDIAGLVPPTYLAGKSLKQVLDNPGVTVRESVLTRVDEGYTIRTEKYRYNRWGSGGDGMIELYDRETDPGEMNNLARQPAYKKYIDEMDSLLDGKIRTCSTLQVKVPEKRIVYKQVDTTSLELHILYPDDFVDSESRPAIIFFFGGGWRSGNINQFRPQAEHYCNKGLISILADYRVEKRNNTSPFEALSDAKSAIRFLRENFVQLGISPEHIVASGGSAGGHLAVATASVKGFDDMRDDTTVSCIPNALILFNPVLDNGPEGVGYDRIKKHFPAFSPFHNVQSGQPPTIIFLGTNDQHISVATMQLYQDKMHQSGNQCDLFIYEGQEHGFFNWKEGDKTYYYSTLSEADKFLYSLGYLKQE